MEAVRILDGLKAGEYADLLEDYESTSNTVVCPRCKSADLKRVFSLNDWLYLVFLCLFLGMIYPAERNLNRCSQCGYTWNRSLKA